MARKNQPPLGSLLQASIYSVYTTLHIETWASSLTLEFQDHEPKIRRVRPTDLAGIRTHDLKITSQVP